MRIVLTPALILFACLLAGAYGAIHNQISYTVSPEYFHGFKFEQFQIPEAQRNRVGASLVGWHASWWMGLLISVPVLLVCVFSGGAGAFVRAFLAAAVIVVLVTLATGLAALAVSYITVSENSLPRWALAADVGDPAAFARAGTMHNFSYLGALVGVLAGIAVSIRAVMASRAGGQ